MIRVNLLTPSTILGDFLFNSDQLLCELRSIFVTKSYERRRAEDSRLESVAAQGIAVVGGLVSSKFSVRVLARLNDEFLRYDNTVLESQDIKIAYLTVLRADEGDLQPWRTAFWQVTGEQPESLIPFWMCSKDAAWDEYFPLSMLPIRFHKDWPSDYLRGKMIAERAREAKLRPRNQFNPSGQSSMRRSHDCLRITVRRSRLPVLRRTHRRRSSAT